MTSFYRSTVGDFLSLTNEQILARLSVGYANRGFTSQYTDQTLSWERDLESLRKVLHQPVEALPSALSWGILLEFSIPRKESRIDVVLLVGETIVILEAKSGNPSLSARRIFLNDLPRLEQCRRFPLPEAPLANSLAAMFDELDPHDLELLMREMNGPPHCLAVR